MTFSVYIIYSRSLDRFYIGMSADVYGRLTRHNSARQGFTSKGQPWEIVYTESFSTKLEALQREKQLKGWKNRERLVSLISEYKKKHE